MHSHRLRYLVFGLLIYIQNAFCRTCRSDFTDVPSRTVRSGVVFEGSVRVRHETFSADGYYNATMKVRKVLKGTLPKDLETDKYKTILVGLFGPEHKENCVYDIGVGTYVIFLDGHNSSSLDPKVPYYRISAFPEPSSTEIKRIVRKYRCEKCGRVPTVRARRSEQVVQQGQRISLKCKVSGRPTPEISWRKDNVAIHNKGRVKIRTSKSRKMSRLQIKPARIEDEGIYTCQASNALGTNYDDIDVAVSEQSPSPVPHAVPCEETEGYHYCLNGGTCYEVKFLRNRFCRCADGFTGFRCRDRDIFDILQEEELKETHNLDRALTISGLAIAGVVVGILILAAYIMSRKKRKNYRKKQAEKRKKAMSQNAEDGAYSAVSLETSKVSEKKANKKTLMQSESTQTEEMMNAPFLGIAAVGRAASMSAPRGGHRAPGGVGLPRQHTAPSLLGDADTPPRGRLSGVSATPETDPPTPATMRLESDQTSSKRSSPSQSSRTESAQPADYDARSDYDNQPAQTDLMEAYTVRPDLYTYPDQYMAPPPTRTPDDDIDLPSTDTDESSSIGEERAIFRNLQSNPRVRSLQSIDNMAERDDAGNIWAGDSWDKPAPFSAFNPYALDNDILAGSRCYHHTAPGRRPVKAARRRHSTDDYVELPYDPDPDATVV